MDGFQVKVETGGLRRDLHEIARRVDRASMYAVREAGRRVKHAAKRGAPVYGGPRRTWPSGDGQQVAGEPGELRKSIGQSRRLRRIGDHGYAIKVGPRGAHVHLYAPVQEARRAYMRPAFNSIEPRIRDIYARAWERAMRRGHSR